MIGAMHLPEPDSTILARTAEIAAGLRAAVPGAWVIDDDDIQFVIHTAGEGRGNLFDDRESKNCVYHGAILR